MNSSFTVPRTTSNNVNYSANGSNYRIENDPSPTSRPKGPLGDILQSFNHEHGYYNTIDLINFLSHYVIGEDAEDKFWQQQIFRNMQATFR